MKKCAIGLIALLTIGTSAAASAQTMSYAEAGARIAQNCAPVIEKYCAKENIGRDQVLNCLQKHAGNGDVPQQCLATFDEVNASIDRRLAAQSKAFQVCAHDIREYCPGVKPGDARVLDCLDTATKVVSATCKQVLLDAGWQ